MRTHARPDEGRSARVVIPAAAGERERERESVCVCVVCVCERGMESAPRELLGEARRDGAVRVGPAWLQRHGCEFVTGVRLEARDGGHTNAKRGRMSESISMPGQGQARGNIYATIRDKYTM
jgi:hypothetical protein